MTNAPRPVLTVRLQPPHPRRMRTRSYKHSPLCLSAAEFLSCVYLCLLSWGPAYGASANAAPLKTIVRCTEGDDYMLCERQNEPSRPPELVQLFYWRLQSMGSGTWKLGEWGEQLLPSAEDILCVTFILSQPEWSGCPGESTACVLLHFTPTQPCKHHFPRADPEPRPPLRPNGPHT